LHTAAAHAILNDIGKVSSGVAAVSSVAAVATAGVPIVGEVAEGVSLTAGSVAVASDVANCIGGHCNTAQLALDGSALIPGVAATTLGSVADDASDTAQLADSAAHASPNSLMDAQTAESSFRGFQRAADSTGFGLSGIGFGISFGYSNS
jgi:hypothetical protein